MARYPWLAVLRHALSVGGFFTILGGNLWSAVYYNALGRQCECSDSCGAGIAAAFTTYWNPIAVCFYGLALLILGWLLGRFASRLA